MSNYVKAVDFESKDSLTSGNPLKIIKGVELNDEFNAIQTAVATKADITSPAFLGNPTALTQASSDNSARLATTAFVTLSVQNAYPVGSVYINASDNTNPATLFGFGTWVAFGTGRMLIGVDVGNVALDTLGETGGSADAVNVDHTHTANSVVTDPSHRHSMGVAGDDSGGATYFDGAAAQHATLYTSFVTTGITVATTVVNAGVTGVNANLPPYVTVYMWKRTV